jgi:hypothetical protein
LCDAAGALLEDDVIEAVKNRTVAPALGASGEQGFNGLFFAFKSR